MKHLAEAKVLITSVTPMLRIPSVAVVWLGPVGSEQLAALHSCAANTPPVACA